jgi:predicted polyphosphate/ATP-dependent NAD kinase
MSRRVCVTGGRDFGDTSLVESIFDELRIGIGDTVVNGGCSGADTVCQQVAMRRLANVETHHANWKEHGRAAGPIRNREMLKSGVDVLIAFPGGRGTADCVNAAKKLGIRVIDLREARHE